MGGTLYFYDNKYNPSTLGFSIYRNTLYLSFDYKGGKVYLKKTSDMSYLQKLLCFEFLGCKIN